MSPHRTLEPRAPRVAVDTRAALLGTLAMIVYAVSLADPIRLVMLEAFLLCGLAAVRASPAWALGRIALVIPFGGILAAFQPFIRPGEIVARIGPLAVSEEGLDLGVLLLLRLLAALTAVVLLNAVTTLPALLEGARRLRLPGVLVDMLGLTARYIPLFLDSVHEVALAQQLRGFSVWDRRLPYRWRLRQLGWAAGGVFLRSLRQGRRTYMAMLCRGLHPADGRPPRPRRVGAVGWVFLAAVGCALIAIHLLGAGILA